MATTFLNGTVKDLEVVGIYADVSLAGDWLIALSTAEAVSSGPASDFFIPILLADGVDPVAAEESIHEALAAYPQADVQSNAEFRDQLEGQINQVLAIISALLFFAIVIAVLGISITMALGVFERTREIGLMRAVGMTKRQTRRMVRWEAVIVSTFGALVGIAVGTLLGVALSLAVPDTVIDRIALSWSTIVLILIGAVIAGLFAALIPAGKPASSTSSRPSQPAEFSRRGHGRGDAVMETVPRGALTPRATHGATATSPGGACQPVRRRARSSR